MPTPVLRRVKRLLIILAVVCGCGTVLHASLHWWLQHTVRSRIADLASRHGADWMKPEATIIELDLWSRSARLENLEWQSRDVYNSAVTRITGRIDSLIVNGVGLRKLLFGDGIEVESVFLNVGWLNITLPTDTSERVAMERVPALFACNHLLLRSGPFSITQADSTTTKVERSLVDGRALLYELGDSITPNVDLAELDAVLAGITRTPFADSTLFVDTLAFHGSGGTLEVAGIRFGVQDVVRTAKTLPVERDVIAGFVERITISGFDLTRTIEGTPLCSTIRIGRASLQVARDKVLRDPAFVHRTLPARMVRALPHGAGVDSIMLEHLDVVYYERVDAERGFARIPFDSITAVVKEVHHSATDTIELRASAIVLGRTPVRLLLRSAIADSADLIDVDASVGPLAFAVLNPVLAPLTGIATPEGRLDTLILRMKGSDRRATARCWMRYDGLKLDRRANKNKALDPVLNGLLNVVVKRKRTGEKDGDGWRSYAWERRRDRALFNYLWSGVREGAKASMLPEAVLKTTSR